MLLGFYAEEDDEVSGLRGSKMGNGWEANTIKVAGAEADSLKGAAKLLCTSLERGERATLALLDWKLALKALVVDGLIEQPEENVQTPWTTVLMILWQGGTQLLALGGELSAQSLPDQQQQERHGEQWRWRKDRRSVTH